MDKGEIMRVIKETTLHPDGNDGVDLYPKTNINQVEKLPQKLTYLETQVSQLNIDKLTKPANPTADSAVTMLADGTVGTKPLSEIGGGKLYLHKIQLMTSDNMYGAYITIINSRGTAYPRNTPDDTGVIFNEKIDQYFINGYSIDTNRPVIDVTTGSDGQELHFFADNPSDRFITFQCCMDDTVTEL